MDDHISDPCTQPSPPVVSFTSEQQLFIDLAVVTRRNLLLVAPAGYGKSFVIKEIVERFRHELTRIDEQPVYALCASTGKAASLIGGRTLHSYLGIGLAQGTPDEWVMCLRVNSSMRPKLEALKAVQVILVDEVSMVSAEFLDKISTYLQLLRHNYRPFGGVQMILIGDLCQLPPVKESFIFRSKEYKRGYFHPFQFTRCFRQNNREFVALLNEVRFGDCADREFATLQQRTSIDPQYSNGLTPMRIVSTNEEVDKINADEMEALLRKTGVAKERYTCYLSNPKHAEYAKKCREDARIPEFVDVAVGCQLVVTHNLTDKIVNGTQGRVIATAPNMIGLELDDGIRATIGYASFKDPEDPDVFKADALFSFMPVRLGYASTVHKAQGMTVKLLEIDFARFFAHGQAYTALSRVTDLQGLVVKNLTPEAFICDASGDPSQQANMTPPANGAKRVRRVRARVASTVDTTEHTEDAHAKEDVEAHSDVSAASSDDEDSPRKKPKGTKVYYDPVWGEVVLGKGIVTCKRCEQVIHRFGPQPKIKVVRNHFRETNTRHKCPFAREVTLVMDAKKQLRAHKPTRAEFAQRMGLFKRRMAQWIYASGHYFDEARDSFFRSGFNVFQPDVSLPTVYELETDLLELEFSACAGMVQRALNARLYCLCLERWTAPDGRSMTNYAASTDNQSYFLRTSQNDPKQRSESMVMEIKRVLTQQKYTTVVGVLTTEAHEISEASRVAIQKEYPECIFYYGCVAHALTRLLTDLCTALPWLERIHDTVHVLLKVVEENTSIRYQLHQLQDAESRPALVQVDELHGVMFYAALESVEKSRKALETLVSQEGFGIDDEELTLLKDVFSDESFKEDLSSAIQLLQPVHRELERVNTESLPLSYVYRCFLELSSFFSQTNLVDKKETPLLRACVTTRFHAILADCHKIAYILDPFYLASGMETHTRHQVDALISSLFKQSKLTAGIDMYDQLARYRAYVPELQSTSPSYHALLTSGGVSVSSFWSEHGQFFPELQQLARAVFSMPPANLTPRHRFAHVTTEVFDKFNGVLPEFRVHKLTYIRCNLKHMVPEEPNEVNTQI
ncbi:hypothetical protein Poli38472_013137 [Pythium oligandrum]|uniref:ATP-dependent DNA helicase n=1 Tax=Pythium oligandrum TaxID=41045 RepID=A0A8K1FAN4_PYTOL|nr:hypothetical protein Poli38472_013137 [Pythium oligandrum]|eukprot:TMW55246.1 hypothetical protein Poli38472_013137 [Pythium oligandrum]